MRRERHQAGPRDGIPVVYAIGRVAVVMLVAAAWPGCATRSRFAEDVSAARGLAAEQWIAETPQKKEIGPPIEGALRLEQSLRLALEHNTELRVACAEKEAARGRVLESYARALPTVLANGGYTRLDEVNRLNIGGQAVSLGFQDNYSAGVTVRQPLFQGHAIPGALRTATLYALWSDETIRASVQGVLFRTASGYFEVLLARKLVEVHRQAERFAETLLEDVKRKRSNGTASDYDVLRAEVELSNARAELIRQRNALDIALARWIKTMGLSPRSRVEPSDELIFKPERTGMSEAIRLAHQNRPELRQAEFAVRMQREAVGIARSAYAPSVSAFFSHTWANPHPHSSMRDEWGDAWTAGLTATWPIFDGFERRGKVAQENARLRQAQTRLFGLEEAVALETQEAVLSLQNAEELVESQQLNLHRAEEGLRLVQAGYRQGVQTELAVMDAQTALTRTQALYYQALYAHMMARLNLQRATGVLGCDLMPDWMSARGEGQPTSQPQTEKKEEL